MRYKKGSAHFSVAHQLPILQIWWLFTSERASARIVGHAVLLLFLLWGSFSAYSYFMKREQIKSGRINTRCHGTSGEAEAYCTMPPEVKQFSKFLMFVTDGWPIKYAKPVFEHYKDHSVTYVIDVPGAKFSHAIYTSFMTGQPPTNYKGEPMAGDHLVRAMKRTRKAEYKLRYVGPEWSFLAIFGKENYYKFFDKVDPIAEPLDTGHSHAYPFFWETSDDRMKMHFLLRELKRQGQSLMAHSGVFDHRQHGEHRHMGADETEFPRTEKLARTMNTDFKELKSWIDENPEYLLILLSDHGVDDYGLAGYRMHGETVDGNEPFMLLYSPSLQPHEPIRIDVIDVCATLAMHLEGVDIPADSLGVARSLLGSDSGQIQALRQNILQLSEVAQERGSRVDKSAMEKLLENNGENQYDKSDGDENPEGPDQGNQYAIQLFDFATSLKENMYSVMQTPYLSVFFFLVMSVVWMLMVLLQYNEGLEYTAITLRYGLFVRQLCSAFVLYFPIYCQVLFCWYDWKKVHDNGYIFIMAPRLCAAVIFYYYGRLASTFKFGDDFKKQKSKKLVLNTKVDVLLLKNEMINFALLFLSQCFNELFRLVDQLPMLRELSIIALLYSIYRHYKAIIEQQKQNQGERSKGHDDLSISESTTTTRSKRHSISLTHIYWTEMAFLGTLVIFIHLYNKTESWEELYCIFEFHVLAFFVMVMAAVVFPLYLLMQRNRFKDLALAFTIVLFLLERDSMFNRFLLLILNYQYLHLLQPVAHYSCALLAQTVMRTKFNPSQLLRGPMHQRICFLFQATMVYLLNHIYFLFIVGFGDRVNFDMHPFSGGVGMLHYDLYPSLSAAFMTLHKYGAFIVAAVHLFGIMHPQDLSAVVPTVHSEEEEEEEEAKKKMKYREVELGEGGGGLGRYVAQGSGGFSYNQRLGKWERDSRLGEPHEEAQKRRRRRSKEVGKQKRVFQWMADHVMALLVLFFGFCNLGLYMMSLDFTKYHAFQECIATIGLSGCLAAVYALCTLVHTYKNNMKVHYS